jgi:hypothetical protein
MDYFPLRKRLAPDGLLVTMLGYGSNQDIDNRCRPVHAGRVKAMVRKKEFPVFPEWR